MNETRADSAPASRLRKAAVFGGAAGLVALYATRGGSYDIVARQELGMGVWLVIGLGYALGLLPRAHVRWTSLLPVAALGALALWTALALSWTESQESTIAELGRVIDYAGLMLLALSVLERRDWRAAAGGLAAAALGVSAVALASRIFPSLFDVAASGGVTGKRLSYPFNYWNAVSAWASMSIVMGLAWSAHARRLVTRALALGAVPLAVLAAYLTYSRTGIANVTVGLVAVLALSRHRHVVVLHALAAGVASAIAIAAVRNETQIALGKGGAGAGRLVAPVLLGVALCVAAVLVTRELGADGWRLPRPTARLALAVLAAAVVLAGAFAGPTLANEAWDSFKTPLKPTGDPADRFTNLNGTRYYLYGTALDAFRAEPLKGTGPGTFEFWWSRNAPEPEFVRDAHSLYLEALAEAGWPGLLLILAFLGTAVGGLVAARRRAGEMSAAEQGAFAALAGGFVVFALSAGVDWMWESTAVAVLGLLCAGVALSLGSTGPSRVPRVVRVGVPVLAVVACLVQLPATVSVSETRKSESSVKAGDVSAALKHANRAIEAQPWAASPYLQRALVLESTGRLPAAKRDVQRAIARQPTNWRPELILSRIEAELGQLQRALAAYRRARKLRPLSPIFARRT